MGLISRLVSKTAPILAPNFVDEIVRYYSVGLNDGKNAIDKDIADSDNECKSDEKDIDSNNNEGNLEKAITVAEELMDKGYNITFDVLGEESKSALEAERFIRFFYGAFDIMKKKALISKNDVETQRKHCKLNPYFISASFSFKPSAFFTKYEEFFYEFTALGQREGFSTTIDMEDTGWLLPTISLYRKMLTQFDNVGTVLQTNVDLSATMLDDTIKLPNARIRVCIGIYNIGKKYGTMDKRVRKERLKEFVKKMALTGRYVEVATHDVEVINELYIWFNERNISKSDYEFQALYHVEPAGLKELHQQLIKEGVNVRLYLPFAPSVDAAKNYGFRRAEKNPEMMKVFARKAFEYYIKRWTSQ